MNKKRVVPIDSDSKPATCEDCRNFTGSAFFFRFGCSKGHQPDYSYTMNREKCTDRSSFTREEQIFRRFQHAPWSGEKELKNKKTAVLRTETSLRKALTEFEKVLTSDQAKAIRDAASAFSQLSRDIEVAGKLLNDYREKEIVRQRQQEAEKYDKIAADYFGSADDAAVLAVAEDLAVLYSDHGREWYRQTRDPQAYFDSSESPGQKIEQYRQKPSAQLLTEIRRKCAACFALMGIGGAYRASYDPSMADFEAFRTWRREQNELMRRIAKGDGIKSLPPKG
jgi:hypothetical protein